MQELTKKTSKPKRNSKKEKIATRICVCKEFVSDFKEI
jgi:hypothetical protein